MEEHALTRMSIHGTTMVSAEDLDKILESLGNKQRFGSISCKSLVSTIRAIISGDHYECN